MKHFWLFFLFLFFRQLSFAQNPQEVRLFYLGGQSNMDGFGYTKDLSPEFQGTSSDVYIFHGNPLADDGFVGGQGQWSPLRPGHGVSFSCDENENHYSDRFGPELSFGLALAELYPGEKIAIIKYSRGGTSLDSLAKGNFGSWEPDYHGKNGINQYDHFMATLDNAYSNTDIDGDGKPEVLIPSGIIWMQGESDAAHTYDIAMHYEQHLKRLMDLLRASFRNPDMPVVIGKISDSYTRNGNEPVWPQLEIVQYAQEQFVKADRNAAIVRNTRLYKNSDPYHYDSPAYIDLGKAFARAVYELNKPK